MFEAVLTILFHFSGSFVHQEMFKMCETQIMTLEKLLNVSKASSALLIHWTFRLFKRYAFGQSLTAMQVPSGFWRINPSAHPHPIILVLLAQLSAD